LKAVALPTVEVHLTDISIREEFRRFSYVSLYAQRTICGQGFEGYRQGLQFLKENYDGKKVAIVAHKAPQLALNVVLNNMTWEDAIANDWRKTGSWQPGWKFVIE
jgi:hypothetical protein